MKSGLALAEAIRTKMHPDVICDLAMRLASDETIPVSERLAALLPVYDRGFIRPPQVVAARIEQTIGPQRDLSKLPIELRRSMLEALRSAPQLTEGNGDGNG